MSELFKPWEYYPELKAERLLAVATVMRDTRERAVDQFDPDEGDSTWSLGCTVYSRTLKKMRDASRIHSWLRILPEREALRFTFTIGGVPVKFYRGSPDDPPAKTLARSFMEVRQQRLALDMGLIESGERILRHAVEPRANGRTAAIWLIESNDEGFIYKVYEIPLSQQSNVVVMPTNPIDIPPLTLKPIEVNEPELKIVGESDSGTGSSNTDS